MKNILITGCGSGLGLALSKNRNHNIFSHYRHIQNPDINTIVGDITNLEVINSFSKFLIDKNIDVFINNAGKYLSGPIEQISDDEIIDVVNTNLLYSILLLKRVYSYFKSKNSGLIININSIAGKNPTSNESVYCASKCGLSGFSKSIQLESVGTNIKIIDIYSGAIQTKMTKNRSGYNTFIDPDDLSSLIYGIIEDEKSYYVNEIILRRN